MPQSKNILFIMCDQLRADYLSCYGHPALETPHLDRLAGRGVRFERAYVQSPICGPSRMCTYTGRYMSSHGSLWNRYPLKVGELTMGDYLRPLGWRTVLVGKTHMAADYEGLARLGLDPQAGPGVWVRECGFEPYERDDGLHPNPEPTLPYNQYLRRLGYDHENPWDYFANSTVDDRGQVLSGWQIRNAAWPANIMEEHSETPYLTGRGLDFINEAGDEPWCLHLSYIKPHWPYVAPAPYHNLYGVEDMLPAHRSEAERAEPHPVYAAFMQHEESRSFARDEVRRTVGPVYMGLVKQIDDQMGRLMQFLEESGRLDKTVIIFTSDHGDYLGDHWLGEKDLYHEEAIRIPLIIVDPSPEADGTRGMVSDALVESIDLLPTLVELGGGRAQPHRLEGRSLLPLLRGDRAGDWRDFVISEIDYSGRAARQILKLHPDDCRATVLRTDRWKYILHERFRPQLFDLANDPHEFIDLGQDPAYEPVRRELHERLFIWFRRCHQRTTVAAEEIGPRYNSKLSARRKDLAIGRW